MFGGQTYMVFPSFIEEWAEGAASECTRQLGNYYVVIAVESMQGHHWTTKPSLVVQTQKLSWVEWTSSWAYSGPR
jgi:hypothetical protein